MFDHGQPPSTRATDVDGRNMPSTARYGRNAPLTAAVSTLLNCVVTAAETKWQKFELPTAFA